MRILGKWGIAAAFVCCGLLFLACANNDNKAPDTLALDLWQAGKMVTTEIVTAFGGIDKCFAAEPIPDGVWQRMQGKTFKENPYIGRDDLRHIRALHWDYDNQMHVGEMVCNKQIAEMMPTTRCRCAIITRRASATVTLLPLTISQSMPVDWPSISTPSTTPTSKHLMTARYSSSPLLARHIATARGTSPIRLITKTSASVSLLRLVSSGAVTGLRVRTTNTLNSLNTSIIKNNL